MLRRLVRTAIAAALVAVALTLTSIAAAGGWAVTTLEPLAAAPTAGETVAVHYTVRQHGVRPVAVDGTGIEIVTADGTTTFFPGTPTGAEGRYVADVTFPAAGSWTWRAIQGWFGPQDLGAIDVLPGASAAAPAPVEAAPATVAAAPASSGGAMAWALLGAALGCLVAFGLVLVASRRPRRGAQPEPA